MYAPGLISSHINVTTPTFTGDFLPTIMALLDVKSDNPTWVMDGQKPKPQLIYGSISSTC
jgi:hypothetical protein